MSIGEPAKRIAASPNAIGVLLNGIFATQWESEPWRWRLASSKCPLPHENAFWSAADGHWRDADDHRRVADRHFRLPMAMGEAPMEKAEAPMSIFARQWEWASRQSALAECRCQWESRRWRKVSRR